MSSITAAEPFARINLTKSPDKFLNEIMENYSLGRIKKYEVLKKGMVELNFKVNDEYVIKIFSNKPLSRAKEILSAQQAFCNQGIPFPKVYKTKTEEPYFAAHPNDNEKAYYGCIIEWLNGNDFTDNEPTPQDLRKIAKYLAMINKTELKITPTYDDCFPINVSKEYERRKEFVEPEAVPLIEEIIQEMTAVNLKKLKYGTIHGDLSWEHVLKNKKGELSLLDLGALNLYPIAFDIAYALSYYCVSPTNPFNNDFEGKYSTMLGEYLKHNELSAYELEHIPLFVKASWAHDYVIGRSYKNLFRDKLWFTPERLEYLLKQKFPEVRKK